MSQQSRLARSVFWSKTQGRIFERRQRGSSWMTENPLLWPWPHDRIAAVALLPRLSWTFRSVAANVWRETTCTISMAFHRPAKKKCQWNWLLARTEGLIEYKRNTSYQSFSLDGIEYFRRLHSCRPVQGIVWRLAWMTNFTAGQHAKPGRRQTIGNDQPRQLQDSALTKKRETN